MLAMLKKIIRIKPEIFFLSVALTFGIFTVFITPPFQSPDEDVHFLSVWRFSSLSSNPYFSTNIMNFVKIHSYLYFKPEQKYSVSRLRQAVSYGEKNDAPAGKKGEYCYLKLETVPWYLPSIAGMQISKLFTCNFCFNMWAGRLFNLIVYSILVFYAIKISPYFKWGFVLLGSMPMTLFLAASLSYDSLTTAISYILIAATLNLLVKKQNIIFSKSWLLLFGVTCISFLKFPYLLITVPLLFLKKYKFEGNFYYCFKIIIISLFLIQFGLKIIPQLATKSKSVKIEIKRYDRSFGAADPLEKIPRKQTDPLEKIPRKQTDPPEQIKKLITKPLDFCYRFFNTLTSWQKISLYIGSFGGCLGWLDTLLPPAILIFFYIALALTPLTEIRTVELKTFDRSIFFLTGAGLFVFLHIIFYLAIPVDSPYIEGIQGRYFIPFAPLLLLPFLGGVCLKKINKKRLYRNMFFMGTVLLVQSISIITLLQRYYFTYWWDRNA